MVVNQCALCLASGCKPWEVWQSQWSWPMVRYAESITRNHVVFCWAIGCDSLWVIMHQWLWIMVSYAEPSVVNHGVLLWASVWEWLYIMLHTLLWIICVMQITINCMHYSLKGPNEWVSEWVIVFRVITVFTVFRLLTDFVFLYTYEFWLSLWKIVQSSVILLLPLLFSAKSSIVRLYHGENKLIFNELMMRSVWYSTNVLSWIYSSRSLKQEFADTHVDPRVTLSWFRA
jgi:hypothetical protein